MGLENLKYIHKDKFDDHKRQSKSTVDSFSLEGNLVKISNDVSLFNNPVINSLEKIKERTFDTTKIGQDNNLGTGDFVLETLYNVNHTPNEDRIQIQHGQTLINTGRAGMGSFKYMDIKASGRGFRQGGPLGFGDGREPYIVNEIGSKTNSIGNNRDILPFQAGLEDASRLAKFYTSTAGLAFIAKENITNVAIGDGLKVTEPLSFVMAPPIPVPNTGFLNFVQQSVQGAGFGSIRRPFKIQYSDLTNFGGLSYANLGDRPLGLGELARIKIPQGDGFIAKAARKTLVPFRNLGLKKLSQAVQVPLVKRPTKFIDLSKGPKKTSYIDEAGSLLMEDDEFETAADELFENGDFYVKIKDLRSKALIYFRGFVTGITENVNPSFTSTNYIGRSEPVYQYERGERDLSFNLRVYPANSIEQFAMYKKLEKLTSLAYPEYLEDTDNSSLTRMKAPFTELYMAHIGTRKQGQFGFIKSLSYTVNDSGDWDSEKSLPRLFDIAISYQILNKKQPSIDTEFYGAYR